MFSLIISIISILLVSALAVATLVYGIYSYYESSNSSKVAYLLNTANTVATAAIFAKSSGVVMSGRSVNNVIILKDKEYLTTLPIYEKSNFIIDADQSLVKIQNSQALTLDVCKRIIADYDNIKLDSVAVPNGTTEGRKYGCHVGSSGAGYYTFYYRFDK
jgi:hypothetical protein